MSHHSVRLANGTVSKVVYFCTFETERAVREQADRFVFRTQRSGFHSFVLFDSQGRLLDDDRSTPSHVDFRTCTLS